MPFYFNINIKDGSSIGLDYTISGSNDSYVYDANSSPPSLALYDPYVFDIVEFELTDVFSMV